MPTAPFHYPQSKLFSVCILAGLLVLGCASAPQIDKAISLTHNGRYAEAELALNKAISAHGKDRLLHHLELGMINHLKGDYRASNDYFELAEQLIEQSYTISISSEISKLLTGPSLFDYQSQLFENSFVNYYKAFNYFKLAKASANYDSEELDSALVEIRKLSHRLEQQIFNTGGYTAKSTKNSDESGVASQVLNVLSRALGEPANAAKLAYRDDAYGHYITALLFELRGDFDNARISYQRAATSYENGFAAQYQLGQAPIKQAWYDVARVMKLDNNRDWQDVAEKHLSSQQQGKLNRASADDAELVIIQHTGTMPRREELNIRLTLDPYSKSLVLWPMPTGTKQQQKAQLAWFFLLHSDTSIFDILQNYTVGNVGTVIQGIFSKRIPIGLFWRDVQKLNLVKALEFGARISVPYYPPIENNFIKTEAVIDGKSTSLFTAEAINRIALQEQIRRSNTEIQLALTRELTKAISAQKAADKSEAGALGAVFKIANLFTASADTRNWLTLPSGVNLARINLSPGEHKINLKTTLNNGVIVNQKQTLNVTAGHPTLWHMHTYKPIGITKLSQ